MKWTLQKQAALLFAVAVIISAIVSYCFYSNMVNTITTVRERKRNYSLIIVLEHFMSLVKDAETGQRGYVLTGKTSYLAPYQNAARAAFQDINRLKYLTAGDPFQQQRLREIQPLMQAKIDELRERMGELIDDLLKLSRITRIDLKQEQINLSNIASQILSEYRRQDPERHVKFMIAENMVIQRDPGLLHIVMENLLNNAWKFTAQKAEAVIEIGQKKENNKSVYFVRDDGIGFNMENCSVFSNAYMAYKSFRETGLDWQPSSGLYSAMAGQSGQKANRIMVRLFILRLE